MTTGSQPPAVRAVIWDLGEVILRTMDWRRRTAWEDRLGPNSPASLDQARSMLNGQIHNKPLTWQQQ